MIIWNGRLNKRGGTWSYDLHYLTDELQSSALSPEGWLGYHLCHVDSMWRRLRDCNPNEEINTWGFSSPGTDQMALAILGWTVVGFQGAVYENVVWGYPAKYVPLRNLLLKHYKDFAKKVLANLPDDWTLTELDVLEWLNKKEKKEFYRKKPKTKRKQKLKETHGRHRDTGSP